MKHSQATAADNDQNSEYSSESEQSEEEKVTKTINFHNLDDKSMTSSEHGDVVHMMADDMEVFRQIDYLWLFNAELKFDTRKDLVLDEFGSAIKPEDYEAMHKLNRQALTNFLK